MWVSLLLSAIRIGRVVAISTTRAAVVRGATSELVSFAGKQIAYRAVKLSLARGSTGHAPQYTLLPLVNSRQPSRACYLVPSPEQLQDEHPGLSYNDATAEVSRWIEEHTRRMAELGVEIPPLALTVEPGSPTARQLLEEGDDLLPAPLVALLAASLAVVGGSGVAAGLVGAGATSIASAARSLPDAASDADGPDGPDSLTAPVVPSAGVSPVLHSGLRVGDSPLVVTSPYGVKRGSAIHKGVDIRARTPLAISLPCDSLVTWVRYDKRGGHSVSVLCASGTLHPSQPVTIILRHLDPNGLPIEGATIPAGTMIARSGNTGTPASGGPYVPHLHLEAAVGAHAPKGASFKKLLVDPASLPELRIPSSD